MSICNVEPSKSAADSIGYAVWGSTRYERQLNREDGTPRAAWVFSTLGDPDHFVATAEKVARVHGRTNQTYNYVRSHPPDEFNPDNPDDVQRVGELACEWAERMHQSDYLVAVHTDRGHLHAHLYVMNHDKCTGKALSRYTSWTHGVRQLNDEMMRAHGLATLDSPDRKLDSWGTRRDEFQPGGFEQTLGDAVDASLRDPRSVNEAAYAEVLAEHGVTLGITERDGYSYKMRHPVTGKLNRRKASRLCPEFTKEQVSQVFDFHAARSLERSNHVNSGRSQEPTDAGPTLARVRSVSRGDRDVEQTDRSVEQCDREGEEFGESSLQALRLQGLRVHAQRVKRERDGEQLERDREHTESVRQCAGREGSEGGDPDPDNRSGTNSGGGDYGD